MDHHPTHHTRIAALLFLFATPALWASPAWPPERFIASLGLPGLIQWELEKSVTPEISGGVRLGISPIPLPAGRYFQSTALEAVTHYTPWENSSWSLQCGLGWSLYRLTTNLKFDADSDEPSPVRLAFHSVRLSPGITYRTAVSDSLSLRFSAGAYVPLFGFGSLDVDDSAPGDAEQQRSLERAAEAPSSHFARMPLPWISLIELEWKISAPTDSAPSP